MTNARDNDAAHVLEVGSVHEASAAIARLLAVTEASLNRRAQLETALRTRVAIEQAKGVLAERHGLELDAAFDVLRQTARSNRLKLHDLVARVRPGEPDPPEIAAALDGSGRRR
jgi:AmiR/NasT family two-component response regulator